MSSNAVAFLRKVLPGSGYYAAFTIDGDRKYNQLFDTVEKLAQHIASEDAAGRAVYHACASFVNARGVWNDVKQRVEYRVQENVHAARSFWLDCDAGKLGSTYATAVEALDAIGRFCRALHLPRPLIVASGSGLHCYWPTITDLAPADWRRYALAIKGACVAHGLDADPVRTADICSVLRTPGTHNRKAGAVRAVELVGGVEIGPYDVSIFDHLLQYGERFVDVRSPAPAVGDTPSLTQALIVEPDYAPVYADTVANGCAQVAALRDTHGNIPEPQWYAALGVLSRCADGQAKAHEWSAGYPRYSTKETQEKFDRTLALTGATTCAKFEAVNPAGCAACPFRGRITSPISLGGPSGAAVNPTQPTNLGAGAASFFGQPHAKGETAGVATLPMLPPPFAWNNRSQLVCITERGEQSVEILISSYPIYLVGVGVGEVRHDRYQLHFAQWRPHTGWDDLFISAQSLMGAGGAAEFASRGANIHDWKFFINYVRAAIDHYHASEKLAMHFDQCGWKEEQTAFLVGDCLYTNEGVFDAQTVSQELATRAQWLGPERGTLAGWSGAANALFASGCEAQSFALIAAFAAPLMRLQASDEGGAVINLLSHGSGTGKTTALAAVYSAWGQRQGLSLTKIDTRVAQAITLGALGNLPVVYDEIGQRDPEVIKEFIQMFTSGRDKMRGQSDGTILHRGAQWQTLLISSSNLSLHDLLSFSGGSDAMAYRALEFTCKLPGTVVAARGDRLRKDLEANAGWAGDAYLSYLLQPDVLAWTRAALEQWTKELWDRTGNTPAHRFWMRTLGAVAVASTLVTQAGILDFKPRRIIEWALDRLQEREAAGEQNPVQTAIGALSQFLAEHVSSVLVVPGPFQAQRRQVPVLKPTARCYMRYELQPPRLLISHAAFTQWLLTQQIGSREVFEALEQINLIAARKRMMTLTAGTEIVGAQQPCIDINAAHPAISGAVAAIVQDNQPQAGVR